jgi:hypothetical protein
MLVDVIGVTAGEQTGRDWISRQAVLRRAAPRIPASESALGLPGAKYCAEK